MSKGFVLLCELPENRLSSLLGVASAFEKLLCVSPHLLRKNPLPLTDECEHTQAYILPVLGKG